MDLFERLSERFPDMRRERDFSFARHTTIGCGGRAAACVYPATWEAAASLLSYLERERIEFYFLGAGANVLPPDGDFEGIIVRFSAMRGISWEGNRIIVGAGTTGGALCRTAREAGIGGFEFLTGIPMTLGGAVAMNAGVGEGHLSDVVERVYALEHGKRVILSNRDCSFLEKSSIFLQGIAVTGVLLRGEAALGREIEKKTAYFRAKRAHLPKGRSMGCTFVNPAHISAGKLIEDCGLKGYSSGGAKISEEHANFIINAGGSSGDVARIIAHVKRVVFERSGILLREEIQRIPGNT